MRFITCNYNNGVPDRRNTPGNDVVDTSVQGFIQKEFFLCFKVFADKIFTRHCIKYSVERIKMTGIMITGFIGQYFFPTGLVSRFISTTASLFGSKEYHFTKMSFRCFAEIIFLLNISPP